MKKLTWKKTVGVAALAVMPSLGFSEAAGGPGCGWGNLLFDGQSGLVPHLAATLVNGTSGNATFGMTSGTNGCSTDGELTYAGKSLLAQVMDEFAEDVARGHGDALDAVAVSLGIAQQDRAAFAALAHRNFTALFPHENVTAGEVIDTINSLMKTDAQLAKYTA